MTANAKTKKETYWRCKKCGDESEFYACPVVMPKAYTTGVRLIGNEADREEIRKVREK